MNGVIYTRFSSQRQREESTEGQIRVCKQYAAQLGISVIKIYSDEAKTGRNDNREAFQQMLRDSESGAFSCVLVYARDRFARNTYEDTLNKHRLKKNGVELISVTQPISSDPEGVLMESLIVGMSEYYSLNLSRAVKRGMKENALKGKSNGGQTPLGYRLENGEMVLDEVYAPVVQEIFRRVANGETQKAIADSLNARGLRTRLGNKFNKGSFHRMLCNRKYLGNYIFDGDVLEGRIPKIIDEETWDRVQDVVGKSAAHYKAKDEYLLYGKIFCDSGHKMLGESAYSKGRRYSYYRCKCRRISKSGIEQLVVDAAVDLFMDSATVHRVAVRVAENYSNNSDAEASRRALQQQLEQTERKVANLVNVLADTSSHAVLEKLEALEAEAEELRTELAYQPVPITVEDVEMYLNYIISNRDGDYQRNIIDALVHRVIIFDDHVVVVFNTSDEDRPGCFKEKSIKSLVEQVSDSGGDGSPQGANTNYFVFDDKLAVVVSL